MPMDGEWPQANMTKYHGYKFACDGGRVSLRLPTLESPVVKKDLTGARGEAEHPPVIHVAIEGCYYL